MYSITTLELINKNKDKSEDEIFKEIDYHDNKFWSEYKYMINDSLKTKVLDEIEKDKVYFKKED